MENITVDELIKKLEELKEQAPEKGKTPMAFSLSSSDEDATLEGLSIEHPFEEGEPVKIALEITYW